MSGRLRKPVEDLTDQSVMLFAQDSDKPDNLKGRCGPCHRRPHSVSVASARAVVSSRELSVTECQLYSAAPAP